MNNASSVPLEPLPFGSHAERRDRGHPRIRDMRFAELAYRGWQEAAKWLERVSPIELPDQPDALLRRHAPELADPEDALRSLREKAPVRFFPGASDAGTCAALSGRFPAEARGLRAQAEGLLDFQFELLGFPSLWFGDPIDWHLDPVRGRRAPVLPWSLIDVRDTGSNGDSRLIWELNRHQWVVRLAQAWVFTRDRRYAAACTRVINGWLDENPPGLGINWASSAEVSMRLMSWCWTIVLLRDAPVVEGPWVQRVVSALWLHATHIRRCLSLSLYCSPNTGLTSEALALFYAGTLFPEFRDAERWREVALRILTDECDAQVCKDGVHFERATCYHRYIVETYLHFLVLTKRNGVHVPDHVAARVQQMVDFLVAIQQPDGTIPAIGDDDGGTLLSLERRAPDDARGLFAVAAAHFRRRDFAWAAGSVTSEVLWLLGPAGVRAFDTLQPTAPPNGASRVFPSGGYVSMRSGWAPDAHHALVDVGPIGCPVSGGHGHADLLSIQCSIFGEPCLVDAGTYSYTGESPWRDYFRSTAAHSTVIVDGISQASPAGPFGWRGQPRVRLREWHSTADFDFLDAEHDGYMSLPDPVLHRRRVIFVKPGYWILVDDMKGTARHQLDLTFQFGAVTAALGPHPWARAVTPRGHTLWICPFPSAPVQPSLKCGELSPIAGWISRTYGERQPAPMLNYSFGVALPWRIVTLLLPDRQALPSPPSVRAIYDDAGQPVGLAFDRPRRVVRFDDRSVSVQRE